MCNEKLRELYSQLSTREYNLENICLITGDLGALFFCLQYSHYIQDEIEYDKIINIIEKYTNLFETNSIPLSLSPGLTGLAWFIEYIEQNELVEIETLNLLDELDKTLFQYSQYLINHEQNYDLFYGVIGVGVYYLLRLNKSKQVKSYLEYIVSGIINLSTEENDGSIKWKAIDIRKKELIDGEYNLGLAHGIPAIISFFVSCYEKDICKDKLLQTIKGATKYVLKQQLQYENFGSYFPSIINDKDSNPPRGSRLAWCYGDLGICCALWKVGKIINDSSILETTEKILVTIAQKKDDAITGVRDAGFCHGTSGIAYIFQYFYEVTGNPILESTAEYWYKRTLELAIFEDGIAGYKTLNLPEFGGWVNCIGLLEGASGIGLSLLYKEGGLNASWDKLLLIS